MPLKYQREVQEKLKRYIYTGEKEKLERLYNKVKSTDSAMAKKYLHGENDEGRSLLSWAALEIGGEVIMEYLISEGARIDHQDGKLRTPLSNAVDRGHVANVSFLLSKRADPMKADFNGDNCLHIAAQDGGEEIINILLAAEADIKATNNSGANPLHIAARYGNVEAIHALFKYREAKMKELMNSADAEGDTPLHYAALDESGKAAKYLLKLGADATKKNKSGETAGQVAEGWEHGGEAGKAIISMLSKVIKAMSPEEFYESVIAHEDPASGAGDASSIIKAALIGKNALEVE